MVKGAMDVDLPEGTRRVISGNVVIFPPKYHYRYVYSAKEPLSYLWVHFTGSYAEKLLKDCGLFPLPFAGDTRADNNVVTGFMRLFDIFQSKGSLQKQELGCSLEHLLLTVASSLDTHDAEARSLKASVRYIHSAYNTAIRIPELAKMENLSNSRYIALFDRLMGMPPSAYIIELRVNAACDLLRDTDMSVKQIGILVGYEDAHFFSKIFKKQTGMSPQHFREHVRSM